MSNWSIKISGGNVLRYIWGLLAKKKKRKIYMRTVYITVNREADKQTFSWVALERFIGGSFCHLEIILTNFLFRMTLSYGLKSFFLEDWNSCCLLKLKMHGFGWARKVLKELNYNGSWPLGYCVSKRWFDLLRCDIVNDICC